MSPAVAFIVLALRIGGAWYCSGKAGKLNRSKGGWGCFGFISPILAIIWIQFMKPITDWSDESSN